MIQSYPEDKLEWVIVDDGDDPIEDTLMGVSNVKYVRCEKGLTISQKRNLGVENAMYDVIVTMDDDDVYKAGYVENIVKMFQEDPTIDVVSSKIKYQLNDYKVYIGEELFDNLGGNPGNSDYHMPMTFAFNNKAFNIIKDLTEEDIVGHDDMMWRLHWEAHGLKHATVDNSEEIIWHIHGKNVSTSGFME